MLAATESHVADLRPDGEDLIGHRVERHHPCMVPSGAVPCDAWCDRVIAGPNGAPLGPPLTGTGEQPARQRAPGNDSHALIHAERDHFPLLFAAHQVVVVLHRREPGGQPAAPAVCCALANRQAYMLDAPIWRALPACTTSRKARMVSSIGVSQFHRWNWYRST